MHRRTILTLIKVIVSTMIITLLVYKSQIRLSSITNLISYPEYLMVAFLGPLVINPLISNNRWKAFLKAQGIYEGFFTLARISFMSVFLGILLPAQSGSDAIRMYLIEQRHKQKIGSGGAAVIIERLLGFYILSVLGVIGAFIARQQKVPITVLFIAVGINVALSNLYLMIRNDILFNKALSLLSGFKRGGRIANYLTALVKSVRAFPIKGILLSTIPLILLFQLSTIVCSALIFQSFGIDIPFYYHLFFMPLIQIISILPVSIAGFGLREGGFVYFYGILGISSDVAFAASIAYYLILTMIPAFIGMILFLFTKNNNKNIERITH